MKLDNKIYEEKMKKTITVLNEEFESIRVGDVFHISVVNNSIN